eukprot:3322782-Heterocapsa_arctica.AAC.1
MLSLKRTLDRLVRNSSTDLFRTLGTRKCPEHVRNVRNNVRSQHGLSSQSPITGRVSWSRPPEPTASERKAGQTTRTTDPAASERKPGCRKRAGASKSKRSRNIDGWPSSIRSIRLKR